MVSALNVVIIINFSAFSLSFFILIIWNFGKIALFIDNRTMW